MDLLRVGYRLDDGSMQFRERDPLDTDGALLDVFHHPYISVNREARDGTS